MFALRHTYGPAADCKFSGREPGDYVNSRLMLLWGWSPGDGHLRHRHHAVSSSARRSRASG
jgi:hypothetical protein